MSLMFDQGSERNADLEAKIHLALGTRRGTFRLERINAAELQCRFNAAGGRVFKITINEMMSIQELTSRFSFLPLS